MSIFRYLVFLLWTKGFRSHNHGLSVTKIYIAYLILVTCHSLLLGIVSLHECFFSQNFFPKSPRFSFMNPRIITSHVFMFKTTALYSLWIPATFFTNLIQSLTTKSDKRNFLTAQNTDLTYKHMKPRFSKINSTFWFTWFPYGFILAPWFTKHEDHLYVYS